MREKPCFYEVTKFVRGGSHKYYIKILPSELNDNLLESIGENTDGGHSYGYSLKAKKIPCLPAGCELLSRTRVIDVY